MLPYTVIKEANPPAVSGTATGVVNFLNFTFSALLGPVFGWILASVGAGASPLQLEHYQTTFTPMLYGVALAIVLTLLLKETGSAAAAARPVVARSYEPIDWHRQVRTGPREVPNAGARSNRGRSSL